MEADAEGRAARRSQAEWDRLYDDERFEASGWRRLEPWFTPRAASLALAKLGAREIRVRCECGKLLGSVRSRRRRYRHMVLPEAGERMYFTAPPEVIGNLLMKWRYVCPLRKCGRQHEVRYDKLTFAFIESAAAGRSEIRLPLRPAKPSRSR
jgi:hypothetical protein